MFPLPWYSIILISIPQTILIIKLGFSLFHLQIDFRRCLTIALLIGIVTYLLRRSSIIPGLHTIILIIFMAAFVTLLNKGNIFYSLASIILGTMIMGIIEGLWCPLFLRLTSHSLEDLVLYPWLNIAGFMPILLVTFIIYIFIQKYNFVIYDLAPKGI